MSPRGPLALVLAGGPDAEHDVSLESGRAVARALEEAGRDVHLHEFETIDGAALRALPGDVVFPALHGVFGEGGPLQRVLEADGRPFVGSGAGASRAAIDKIHTKTVAAALGVGVPAHALLNPADPGLPSGMAPPVVVKPVFEGSTIGLHVCRDERAFEAAHRASIATGKPCMVEAFAPGRELTLGLVDRGDGLTPLPVVEITPADGLYDYEAKYTRDDTRYDVGPVLPDRVEAEIRCGSMDLARALGIRDLCRADFILDDQERLLLLEINTMPGFTAHSLVPMAARHAGLPMAELCDALLARALARGRGDGADTHGPHVIQEEDA